MDIFKDRRLELCFQNTKTNEKTVFVYWIYRLVNTIGIIDFYDGDYVKYPDMENKIRHFDWRFSSEETIDFVKKWCLEIMKTYDPNWEIYSYGNYGKNWKKMK